jgi:exopolyphosphatase/guanosine-5'-triphosphate,3'-diphosphate pyrophosphatase
MIGQQFISEHKYIAGIDIGTNTILMMIAKIENDSFEIISDNHSIARLGEGVDKTGIINDNAIIRAEEILEKYRSILDELDNVQVIAVGTSALRDAKNKIEVLRRLSDKIGTEIKVISGEIEAGLSYIGAVENSEKCLMIDIGGGSTELSIGENKLLKSRHSFNFGSVRITEKFFTMHPPKEEELTQAELFIEDLFKDYILENDISQIYGVAGTMTTIASIALNLNEFSKNDIHNKIINLDDVKNVLNNLLNSTLDEISCKYHVNPKRADVITAGVLIARAIIKKLNLNEITISSDGLRTGIIKNYFLNLFTL